MTLVIACLEQEEPDEEWVRLVCSDCHEARGYVRVSRLVDLDPSTIIAVCQPCYFDRAEVFRGPDVL